MKLKKTLLGFAAAAAATAALASITFDPATGTGFVGKGNVQLAWGWNNATLQANAPFVTFSYDTDDNYTVGCEFDNAGGTHDITVHTHAGISAVLDGDPRKTSGQRQFTGFILKGYVGTPTVTGTVPVVGGTCPGGSSLGLITAVSLTTSTGGLYSWFGGDFRLL